MFRALAVCLSTLLSSGGPDDGEAERLVLRTEQPVMAAANLEDARRWYGEVLGYRASGEGRLARQGYAFELVQGAATEPAAFEVDDIARLEATLKAKGAQVLSGPVWRAESVRYELKARGPDGAPIAFYERFDWWGDDKA